MGLIVDRKQTRKELVTNGSIYAGPMRDLVACQIIDISAGGARLRLGEVADVPDVFILLLSVDGKVRRFCRKAWKRQGDVGVSFFSPEMPKVEVQTP